MASLVLCAFLFVGSVCAGKHPHVPVPDKALTVELHKAAAARDGSIDSLLSVINRGADVNALTKDGESALHLACIYGHAPKVRLLLGNGADPNRRANKLETSLYMTPLSWCTYGGHEEAVRMLLQDDRIEVNSVVFREDKRRMTAVDIAESIGEMGTEILQMLRAVNGKSWAELLEEAGNNEVAVLGFPELIDYARLAAEEQANADAEVKDGNSEPQPPNSVNLSVRAPQSILRSHEL